MQPNDEKQNKTLVVKTLDALEVLNQELEKLGKTHRYTTLPYDWMNVQESWDMNPSD